MTFLYNCRHSGDQYRITKLNQHFEPMGDSSYLCTLTECTCPAGHRPSCRHRDMLPKFIQREHIGDNWFFDFDRGGWVQGAETEEPAEQQYEEPEGLDEDSDDLSSEALPIQQEPLPLSPDFTPIFLPPSLYDAAVAEGHDMRYYRKQELLPIEPSPSPPPPTIRRRV